jgi:ADP-ribosylglycohydrolase
VNHGGDSDSTGAIAGNLLGTALGAAALPEAWTATLPGRDVIARVASDLLAARRHPERPVDPERYPPA